jgi:hypothetical protein
MEREYEIFECLPDGGILWCTRGSSLQNTRLKLDNLVRNTGKEYFAMHLLTREMVFPIGLSKIASERVTKRIFQIAYTDRLRLLRGELLRNLGYAVISAIGNEAAKSLLTTLRQDDLGIALFIIGHAAPAPTRKAMVDWLKEIIREPGFLHLTRRMKKCRMPTTTYYKTAPKHGYHSSQVL